MFSEWRNEPPTPLTRLTHSHCHRSSLLFSPIPPQVGETVAQEVAVERQKMKEEVLARREVRAANYQSRASQAAMRGTQSARLYGAPKI